jgi:hypothetical protein
VLTLTRLMRATANAQSFKQLQEAVIAVVYAPSDTTENYFRTGLFLILDPVLVCERRRGSASRWDRMNYFGATTLANTEHKKFITELFYLSIVSDLNNSGALVVHFDYFWVVRRVYNIFVKRVHTDLAVPKH